MPSRTFSGRRLCEARTRRGLRPEHLAVHLNRSALTVRRWERGTNIPSADAAMCLAEALNIPVDDLFEQVDE